MARDRRSTGVLMIMASLQGLGSAQIDVAINASVVGVFTTCMMRRIWRCLATHCKSLSGIVDGAC